MFDELTKDLNNVASGLKSFFFGQGQQQSTPLPAAPVTSRPDLQSREAPTPTATATKSALPDPIKEFGANLGNFFVKTGSAYWNGIKDKPFLTPVKTKYTPTNENALQVVKNVGSFLNEVWHGFGKEGAGLALEIQARLKGVDPSTLSFQPGAPGNVSPMIETFLMGKEPVKALSAQGTDFLKSIGIPDVQSHKYGLPLGMAMIALDVTGGGSAEKSAAKLLAKASTAEEVINILKSIKGIDAAKITEDLAGKIAKSKDVTMIASAIRAMKVKAPVIVGDLSKERGFITSVKEQFPEATKVAGQYIPRSTDELATKARNLILDDINEAEHLAFTGTDDKAVATASELIKHYSEQAALAKDTVAKASFEQRMADVANSIAPKLTEAGRTVQAATILARLTPEGMVRFAAGEIDKFNEAVRASRGRSLSFAKEIPPLTGKQAGEIVSGMKEVETITDPIKKAEKLKKVQDKLDDLIPSPMWQKITSVWKAGLLTGVKTTGLNVFSNITHGVLETVKDIPAAAIDSIAGLFTGERKLAFNLQGEGKGLKEGLEKGWRYFRTGIDERNVGLKYDYKKVNFGNSIFAKTLQKYEETIFRALGAEDQPFYYGAKARSIYDQAKAQAKTLGLKGREAADAIDAMVKNPTDEMLRYAAIDAETAVFQNKTVLGDIGTAIQQKGKLPGNVVVPFSRTPASVMTQVINYSPIGIVKTIAQNIGKGHFDQRLFAQGLGRGLTGTALTYLGTKLMQKELLTLDYPKDEREQEMWKAEGKVPNAVKIDGKWRSVQVLGPAATLILIGAHFQRAMKESGSISGAVAKATWGGIKSFSDQTFLQGVQTFVDAMKEPDRYAEAYFGNLLGSTIPTIVNDVAKAHDTYDRRARSILERAQTRIPFLREQLQPQVDVYGNDKTRGGNIIETMIDPTRPSAIKDSPVIDEIKRLSAAGFNVAPTLLGTKDGYSSLTPAENTQLLERAGRITESKLENLFRNKKYIDLTDEEKSKTVTTFVQKSKDAARAEMVVELTDGLSGPDLKEKLSELKKSGLLTSDVYTLYQKIR